MHHKLKVRLTLFIRQGDQRDLNWLCWRRVEQIRWISLATTILLKASKHPSMSQSRWSLFSKTTGADGFGIIQFIQSWLAISTLHVCPILPLILGWFCDSKPNFGHYDFFLQLTGEELMWGLYCSLPWKCFYSTVVRTTICVTYIGTQHKHTAHVRNELLLILLIAHKKSQDHILVWPCVTSWLVPKQDWRVT